MIYIILLEEPGFLINTVRIVLFPVAVPADDNSASNDNFLENICYFP